MFANIAAHTYLKLDISSMLFLETFVRLSILHSLVPSTVLALMF